MVASSGITRMPRGFPGNLWCCSKGNRHCNSLRMLPNVCRVLSYPAQCSVGVPGCEAHWSLWLNNTLTSFQSECVFSLDLPVFACVWSFFSQHFWCVVWDPDVVEDKRNGKLINVQSGSPDGRFEIRVVGVQHRNITHFWLISNVFIDKCLICTASKTYEKCLQCLKMWNSKACLEIMNPEKT